MQEFVRRMISERDELSGRIKKARKALDNPPFGASEDDMRMLAEQVRSMEQYLYWLNKRIGCGGR